MSTKSQPEAQTQALPRLVTEMQAKTLDAVGAFAQASHRVVQEVVELSTTTAKEGMRTYAELQAAALAAAREAQAGAGAQREAMEDLKQDPCTWYQKSLLTAMDGTQTAFKLLEANAQILTRSAERLQASAQRTGKEIQEALTSYMSRMKEISGRN